MRLEKKVAVVTGGGSGIGRAICSKFAAEGAKIVVADINAQGASETAEELRGQGSEAVPFVVDAADYQAVQSLVQETLRQYSAIDVLVVSHGISEVVKAEDLTPDSWRKMIEINLTGVFFCCQLVGREMIKRRLGKIITISSASGVRGEENNVHYVAAKHGVVGLTSALALDFGPYGVNVNCICPALTLTPRLEKGFPPEALKERIRFIPLGRCGRPEDQANAALFLASAESDYINGHTLYVEGGLLAAKYFRH